jgi:hypothetical protein
MHVKELDALERTGGPVLEKYRRLVAADASQMDSPAQQELAAFFRDWQRDPAVVIAAAESEAQAKGAQP